MKAPVPDCRRRALLAMKAPVAHSAWMAVLAGVIVVSCRCACSGQQQSLPPAAPGASAQAAVPDASAAADRRIDAESQAGLADADAGDAAAAAPKLEPLVAEGPYVPLPVEGFRDAIVSVPLGATDQRPVVVALHGNFDRPEWQCQVWREITAGFPFVLCPRGIPRGDAPKAWDRWTYGAMKKVKEELFAGLEALSKRFGEYVDDGPVVFTGFSLGAILGRYIIKEQPKRFSRVVLTEGGNKGWDWLARAFKQGGGERVLFACGQPACVAMSRAAARQAESVELDARVADGGKAGHTYDGTVMAAIMKNWDWLLEGDARWPGAADAGVSPE